MNSVTITPRDSFLVQDRRRLLVAKEGFCLGEINSYNNFLTRFFAALLGLSVKISFHGKIYHVNRSSLGQYCYNNSFVSPLLHLKFEQIISFEQYVDPIMVNPQYHSQMQFTISRQTQKKLSKQMRASFACNHENGVLAAVYQGANLYTTFALRELSDTHQPLSPKTKFNRYFRYFGGVRENLKKIKCTSLSPLAAAYLKKMSIALSMILCLAQDSSREIRRWSYRAAKDFPGLIIDSNAEHAKIETLSDDMIREALPAPQTSNE